jgi:methionine--tRNA ligase beta chain
VLLYNVLAAEPGGPAALESATVDYINTGEEQQDEEEAEEKDHDGLQAVKDGEIDEQGDIAVGVAAVKLGRTGSAGSAADGPAVRFDRLDIRVGTVAAAASIAAADTLLCITVELGGGEQRQVVSGLAASYRTPAALVGTHALVVCNVAPRELCGLRSEAGLLVAYFGEPERRELVLPAAAAVAGEPLRLQQRGQGREARSCRLREPAAPPDLLIDLSAAGGRGAPNAWKDCAGLLAVAPETGELLMGGVALRTVAGPCTVGPAAAASATGCTFR